MGPWRYGSTVPLSYRTIDLIIEFFKDGINNYFGRKQLLMSLLRLVEYLL
jgi:hypothetical protein